MSNTPGTGSTSPRYVAFISYNHRDRAWARWLHRAIETYVPPRKVTEALAQAGRPPVVLKPVFMDREELASSADLAASVRAALEQAATLIVICSPNSARSRWVNEEVRTFRALGRGDRIRCLIVDGEPHAGGDGECFAPALLHDDAGLPLPEPLGADVRATADGKDGARLKIIAGLLDIPYDSLRQREQARRMQRLAWLATAATVGFILMAGLAVVAVLSRQEAVAQRQIAERKTLTAERTAGFITSLFKIADPSEARGNSITVREMLDRGAAQIRQGLADEPTVRADLMTTLGEVYTGLGLYRQGSELVREAWATPGQDAAAQARQNLAIATIAFQQGDYAQARDRFQAALTSIEAASPVNPRLRSDAERGVGDSLSALGEMDEAETVLQAALQRLPQAPEFREVRAALLESIGTNAFYADRFADAQKALDQALPVRLEVNGPLHPSVSLIQNLRGAVAYRQGDSDTAVARYRDALAVDKKVLGERHPMVALTKNNLARVLLEQRDFRQALPLLEEAVAITVAERGPTHDDLAFVLGNLGIAQRGLGQQAASVTLARALAIAEQHDHRMRAPLMLELAELDCRAGSARRGVDRVRAAAPVMRKDYPDDAWRQAMVQSVEARCLVDLGERTQAQALAARATPIILARWAPESLYGADAQARLADVSARSRQR
jgi:tetratricopeptide (TPR) repeat protein